MNSGDAWFADASVNGTSFNFLMDTGACKSVMSSRWFMSIPEVFRPQLNNMKMRFQVTSGEVISSMGVAHVTIQMYGYTFNLPIFVCDLGEIDCIFGLDTGKEASFITCAWTGRIWFNANQHDEPNNCQGAICQQLRELNLNVQSDNYQSNLCKDSHFQKMEWVTSPLNDRL